MKYFFLSFDFCFTAYSLCVNILSIQTDCDKPNGDSIQFEDEKETDDLDLSGIGGDVLSENDVDYSIQFDSECKMDGDSDGSGSGWDRLRSFGGKRG